MQVACLARCNGAEADLHRHGAFSKDEFRSVVQEASASEQQHVIVSYSRKELLQTGTWLLRHWQLSMSCFSLPAMAFMQAMTTDCVINSNTHAF